MKRSLEFAINLAKHKFLFKKLKLELNFDIATIKLTLSDWKKCQRASLEKIVHNGPLAFGLDVS